MGQILCENTCVCSCVYVFICVTMCMEGVHVEVREQTASHFSSRSSLSLFLR